MKKENRLRKNHQFQNIITKKQMHVSKYVVLYFKKNNLNTARIGISVSKKFANAVGRNKHRRQVRAILDLLNPFDKSYDIVIIVRKPFIEADFEVKKNSLKKLIERLI